MKEKELFQKIRDKLQSIDVVQVPSDEEWNELLASIKEEEDKKKRRFVILWWRVAASILLITSISLGYLLLDQMNTKTAFTTNKNSLDNVINDQQTDTSEFSPQEYDNLHSYDDSNNEADSELTILPNNSAKSNHQFKEPKNNIPIESSSNKKAPIKSFSATNTEPTKSPKSNLTAFVSTDMRRSGNTHLKQLNNTQDYKTSLKEIQKEPAQLGETNIQKLMAVENEFAFNLSEEIDLKKLVINQNQRKEPKPSNKKFTYSILVKPMASSASLNQFGELSSGLGSSIRYKASEKIFLNLDFSYSKQNFDISGTDYSGIDGYWENFTNSEVPRDVNAYSQTIEFPLTTHYKILTLGNGDNFTAGTGLHNQIKLYERHNFLFQENANPTNQAFWHIDDNDLQLANGLSFNLGYHTKIAQNFNISFQPYINIPLQENAWGQLEINNKGIAIAVSPR